MEHAMMQMQMASVMMKMIVSENLMSAEHVMAMVLQMVHVIVMAM
mgnify:CR=1 FL=1